MAEWAVFSVASKLLITIASPAFKKAFDKAYEKGQSIWKARDELDKLKRTIQTIQARLLDAEKKRESSAAVKDWIKRVKEVLYDAEDLFDEVATDDMLKQQMKKGNDKLFLKKVRVSCSKLNPIISRNSIAKKVKAIRKSLLQISADMNGFQFVLCEREEEVCKGLRGQQDPGVFVDAKNVIGRDEDKKAILEMLFDEFDNAVPVVISIVGIGGMGKTTLAQLIYNDEEVKMKFQNRWFACISDTSDKKEVIGKIFQSISGENYSTFDVGQLQTKIRESIEDMEFLLVLDDVWDVDRARWKDRMSLLGGAAKGSKIIVTTRIPEVAKAVGSSLKTHNLKGLSEDESWSLFKSVAFTFEKENDPRWTDLGREIVKKCRNVPLAIKSIGSLLFEKNTIQEWESFKDKELSKLDEQGGDSIISALKLSYDHLPSYLKHCFAYCSLFPEDFKFDVQKLIYLWIAQGYIDEEDEEEGRSCFLYLLRRGFFQEAEVNEFGEIESCKMHDLIHDLAVRVAGEESIVLTSSSSNTSYCARHVSIAGFEIDESWAIPTPLLDVKGLRSCLFFFYYSSRNSPAIDQLFASFKVLRALNLSSLEIKNVSSAIGELKHLRYLDLSWNHFKTLPDSMTNLVNLLTLDISWCGDLKALPCDFRKLMNLRFLNIEKCYSLKHMPGGMGEMRCLQYLSHFKVGKVANKVEKVVKKKSGLEVLGTFQDQLRGKLSIEIEPDSDEEKDWDLDGRIWKLPVSLQGLQVWGYPGKKFSDWNINETSINNLASLELRKCYKVIYLPPLRLLPNLRILTLCELSKLEYVEEEEHNNASSSIFFPRLEELRFKNLPGLKRWWRNAASTSSIAPPHFPLLSNLSLKYCPKVEPKYFPLDPHLREQCLDIVDGYQMGLQFSYSSISPSSSASTSPPAIKKIKISGFCCLEDFKDEAFTSLRSLEIWSCNSLKSLHLTSPHLEEIFIWGCHGLLSFELLVEATTASLRYLKFDSCDKLKNLRIAGHLNALEELRISWCKELELWESPDKSRCHLDWDSFTNLRQLILEPLPPPEKLPQCMQQLHALGQLKITDVK